jgi:hypothetical protein
MAAVDKIAKTGKRGAAKDLRKHTHTFLEWCVSEGYVDHNVLAGYPEPKETRAQRVTSVGSMFGAETRVFVLDLF